MTKEQLHKKHKLEDFFYLHENEDYEHDGFVFRNGEYYDCSQDEGGQYLIDDNGKCHDVYDLDINKLSFR